MAKHEEMMILPAEERREFFRKAYALNMGKCHAVHSYRWPIEKLPDMVDKVMAGLEKRQVPSGPAFDATMKFFQIKTQKALWAFLGAA